MKPFFIAFLCFAAINCTIAAENILWKRPIRCDSNSVCTLGAMTIDSLENRVILLGTSEQRNKKETHFQLWKIDPNGENIQTKSLGKASEVNKLMTRVLRMKATVNPKSGDTIGLNMFSDTNGVSLSITDKNMQSRKTKIASEQKWSKGLLLNDMISCPNDRLIFVGKDSNSNGVVIKTDLTGKVIWKKTLDLGQNEVLSSGACSKDGNHFYVAGLSASIIGKMQFSSAATICLLCYDENGELKKSTYIEGSFAPWPTSFPKVVCLSSGDVLVVYDKSKNAKVTELYIKSYTQELDSLYEKLILQTKEGSPPASFDIHAISENRFVFAGVVNFEDLRFYECEPDGTVLQTLELDGEVGTGGAYVDYLPGRIFVAFAKRMKEGEKGSNIELLAVKPYQTN